MKSIIETMLAPTDLQFAKNVIAAMKENYTLPFDAVKFLDKKRKQIYWKVYSREIDYPNWYESDNDNMYPLKEFIKYMPYFMAEDYIGFDEQWIEDKADEGKPYKIDCRKIRNQFKKIIPIIEKIQRVRLEMKLPLKEAVKVVEFLDWQTKYNYKLQQLYISYKADTGTNKPFIAFANYLFKTDKNIVNWHKKAA